MSYQHAVQLSKTWQQLKAGRLRAFSLGLVAAVAAVVVLAGVLVGVMFIVRRFTKNDNSGGGGRDACVTDDDCKPSGKICTSHRCVPPPPIPDPDPGPKRTKCADARSCGGEPFCVVDSTGQDRCNCRDSEGNVVPGVELTFACVRAPPDEAEGDRAKAYREAGGFVDAGNLDAVARLLGWDEVKGAWGVRQLSAAKRQGWSQADPLPVFQSAPDDDPANKFDKANARFCVDKLPAKESDPIAVTRCKPDEKYCRAGQCAAAFADPPSRKSGLGASEIAGIVVGGVVLLLLVVYVLLRRGALKRLLRRARLLRRHAYVQHIQDGAAAATGQSAALAVKPSAQPDIQLETVKTSSAAAQETGTPTIHLQASYTPEEITWEHVQEWHKYLFEDDDFKVEFRMDMFPPRSLPPQGDAILEGPFP